MNWKLMKKGIINIYLEVKNIHYDKCKIEIFDY